MSIEQEIQSKGLTAPRVTPQDIENEIVSEHYFTALDGAIHANGDKLPQGNKVALSLMTFCVLVLRNGFTVTGESACASPENFHAGIGREIARANAVNKLWPLLGFRLKDRLSGGDTAPPQRPLLTDEEVLDTVRDCGLDWHAGYDLDERNRYEMLARAIERKVRGRWLARAIERKVRGEE